MVVQQAKNYAAQIFFIELFLFTMIVTSAVPRFWALPLAGILALYTLLTPLDETVLFFVASIPLFIAIPITATFDNFNTWRILSLIIFLKWVISNFQFSNLNLQSIFKSQFFKHHVRWHKEHPVTTLLLTLLLLSFVSLIGAPYLKIGLKKIIYLANLSMVGIVIYDLLINYKLRATSLLKSIATATVLVVIVGYLQLISTYLMDIYQFMNLWGERIQYNQFGAQWSHIAVWVGNTWLAYYGAQLSLRVFSLFPDSHSFPIFVLMGVPALFALSLEPILKIINNLKVAVRTKSKMFIVWVPLTFLITILTGTRGIWAASVPVVVLATLLIWWFKKNTDQPRRNLFKYISLYLILFFMLFSVAYPVFISPQFLLSKGDWGLLGNRIRSIIDFGETSNALRLKIWKETLVSIRYHPLLGVGIGNYPVVLGQKIELARAGSSAHNIYLHIAAEMGIPALLLVLWFLWLLFQQNISIFLQEKDSQLLAYFGASLLFIPWVLAYLMTDAALFDERAFLLFAVTCALIFAKNK